METAYCLYPRSMEGENGHKKYGLRSSHSQKDLIYWVNISPKARITLCTRPSSVSNHFYGLGNSSLVVLFQQVEEILYRAPQASERHFVESRGSGVEYSL